MITPCLSNSLYLRLSIVARTEKRTIDEVVQEAFKLYLNDKAKRDEEEERNFAIQPCQQNIVNNHKLPHLDLTKIP